jgi:hypothetical protein
LPYAAGAQEGRTRGEQVASCGQGGGVANEGPELGDRNTRVDVVLTLGRDLLAGAKAEPELGGRGVPCEVVGPELQDVTRALGRQPTERQQQPDGVVGLGGHHAEHFRAVEAGGLA